MYKAVFRIEEVSTKALHLCAGHMTRELKETDLHIDKERIKHNITLIGSSSVVKVKSEVLDEMSKYKAHDSRTADSLATGILTANKDYFDSEFTEWREDSSVLQPWIDANLRFLNSGHLSVVKSAVLHLDEEAPHIHFVAVPVATVTRGNRYGSKEYQRLNYNALFSDSLQHIEECRRLGTTSTDTKLGRLQTEYAKFVECVNLERGVTSEVRHVSPKKFRKLIQQKTQKVATNFQLLTPRLLDYKKTHLVNVNQTNSIIKKLVDKTNEYAELSAAKDVKIELLNDKVIAQERTIMTLQEQIREQAYILRENKTYIDAMRHLKSDDVIKAFSYKKEAYADYNFNKKFNAIDFVKHVEKCDFNTALVLVSEHFSEDDIKHIVVESTQIQTKVNQVMSNAINKNDDLELESFKRDISLVDFAASHAFYTKTSSSSSATMVDGGNKIVVSRKNDNDVFFDVHDETKSGTIIDFCKHYLNLTSLGDIRKTLRAWIGNSTVDVKHAKRMRQKEPTKLKPASEDKTVAFYKLKNCADSVFLRKRDITIESDDIRIDERGNACFPHYDENAMICGWEVKNEKFKGFSAGGKKGFGQIMLNNNSKNVVIAESMIDALSYAQLHPEEVGVCMSTGGSASDDQLRTLARYVSDDVRVFIATDADEAGEKLSTRLQALIAHAERDVPVRKDWNDVLTAKARPRSR